MTAGGQEQQQQTFNDDFSSPPHSREADQTQTTPLRDYIVDRDDHQHHLQDDHQEDEEDSDDVGSSGWWYDDDEDDDDESSLLSTDSIHDDERHHHYHRNDRTDESNEGTAAGGSDRTEEMDEGAKAVAAAEAERQKMQTDLRKQIIQIQMDASIDPAEKSKRIQKLMTSQWQTSASKENGSSNDQSNGEPSDQDKKITYHEEDARTLGCKHYQRGAKMQANCCGKWYTCRFCHDEANDHALIRHDTKTMMCMRCSTVQPAAQDCKNADCGVRISLYYCDVCKLWDDDSRKNIYHCEDCGICRLGRGLGDDFFHCKKCNICMAIELEGGHKCIERNLECDCPICGEYMFTSTTTVIFMPCGHCIHYECHQDHIQTSYQCPTCWKSLGNMQHYFDRIDAVVAGQKMPAEYANFVSEILCNDCEQRSYAKYHFLYHKCARCSSYNTKVLQTLQSAPADGAEPPSLAPSAVVGTAAQMTREETDLASGSTEADHQASERGAGGTESMQRLGVDGPVISNLRNRAGSTVSNHRPSVVSLENIGLRSVSISHEHESDTD